MKNFVSLFLVLCLLLCLAACQREPADPIPVPESSTQPSSAQAVETEPSEEIPSQESEESSSQESEESSPQETEPYSISNCQAYAYRTDSGSICAFLTATVTNTGTDTLFLDYAECTLTDAAGETVAYADYVAAYPQIIAPGEKGYYCEIIPLDVAEADEFNLSIAENIVTTDAAPTQYDVSEVRVETSPYGYAVSSGTVKNNTQADGDLVCVCTLLFTADEIPCGFILGYLDDALKAGQSAEFSYEGSMLPPNVLTELTDHHTVYALVWQ